MLQRYNSCDWPWRGIACRCHQTNFDIKEAVSGSKYVPQINSRRFVCDRDKAASTPRYEIFEDSRFSLDGHMVKIFLLPRFYRHRT